MSRQGPRSPGPGAGGETASAPRCMSCGRDLSFSDLTLVPQELGDLQALTKL